MIIEVLDIIGVFFLAISGILTAADKGLDFFGGYIIAFIAALGGGTIRDLFLNTTIAWMHDMVLITTVLIGATVGMIFRVKLRKLRKTFFVFDTLGMSVFAIAGVQKGLEYEQLFFVCLLLGVISASFGGVIRDVLCNDIPLIFRKEVYATACLAGAVIYLIGTYLGFRDEVWLLSVSMLSIILIRTFAVYKKWHMPLLKDIFNF